MANNTTNNTASVAFKTFVFLVSPFITIYSMQFLFGLIIEPSILNYFKIMGWSLLVSIILVMLQLLAASIDRIP